LTTNSTSPAKEAKEEMTISEELSFFICPPKRRFLSIDYSRATNVLFCEEKSSISHKFMPKFWKKKKKKGRRHGV